MNLPRALLVIRGRSDLGRSRLPFFISLEASGISFVDYDISSSTEEHLLIILRDVETVSHLHLNVLILCDVTATVSVLHQMGHNTKARVWTLMFHPSGRAFTDVALSDETVTHPTEVFPNVKFGYNGRQLIVTMKQNNMDYGYEIVNNRKVYGYPFRILKILAESMNFSYRVIPPREDEWGKNINGSWTGVFGMLQRREVDLASDILSIHFDRTAVSDYILPSLIESKRMILYKKDEIVDEDNLLVFLRSFQPGVFLMFGVSMIIFAAVLSSVILFHKKGELKNDISSKDNNMTITSTVFEVYGATLKQGSTISSSYDSERIMITGWWIFTTIISAVYCGSIMATDAVKIEVAPFSSMAELVSRKDYTIGYDSSSITENIIQSSNLSYIGAFVQRIRGLSIKDPGLLSSNLTKHWQRVQEGKYALITGTLTLTLTHSMCQIEVIDARLATGSTAFHVPKSSLFKHDLQRTMYFLRDSGFLDRTFQEWLQSIPEETCREETLPKSVSLIKIQSIFFAAGIGLGCSSLILMAEIVWHMLRHKR
ncbi:probable glutamate receptor [Haliotis cracherodii]|uniref:probable glutamate receptor n=1 Tax=Haliotis cracherodii TaxID=6455 RepID=UPI0039E8FB9B